MLSAPEERFLLRNRRNDAIIARRLEPAFDSASRRKGLLGRTMFDEGAALIIAPCSAVHTFFMRMAIDIAFVSRGGQILKTYSSLKAWRIAVAPGAFAAIELPSGTLSRADTRAGDPVFLANE
jgi:uncharacterized protein